jgi:hypothetical protein
MMVVIPRPGMVVKGLGGRRMRQERRGGGGGGGGWGSNVEAEMVCAVSSIILLPGGTVGYPAHPRLIHPSVRQSVCHIRFTYSAENRPGPTDLVKYCLKT